MKVQLVSYTQTEEAEAQDRHALTPELMCAVGARYSRSNEGLENILQKVDKMKPSQSIDSIFRMVDYGHASISDMAVFSMFMDDISMYAAYYIWSVCPTSSGQESSSRYIKLNREGLVDPITLGIPKPQHSYWGKLMDEAFNDYESALEFWTKLADEKPELIKIPKELLEDKIKNSKAIERIKRNYAFDRARVYLPVSSKTNMMLVMSARGWVNLVQLLLSSNLNELNLIGEAIASEMKLVVPRLVKHAKYNESTNSQLNHEFNRTAEFMRYFKINNINLPLTIEPSATLTITPPTILTDSNIVENNLKFRTNRYSLIGSDLQRTSVTFSWSAVSFAEIRDFNRHRTGSKYCPLAPLGFYNADDQIPTDYIDKINNFNSGEKTLLQSQQLLLEEQPYYIYYTLLGHQYFFEHSTTANMYIYEMELRSGAGSHYRYAKHAKDSLELFYKKYPSAKGIIFEGTAEPE